MLKTLPSNSNNRTRAFVEGLQKGGRKYLSKKNRKKVKTYRIKKSRKNKKKN